VTRGAIWGGGERHVASLLEGFHDRSVRMSLAVFSDGGLAREARRLNVTVHYLPKRFRGDPGPLWGLVQVIRRHRVDIVHTHMTSGNFYGRVAARLARGRGLMSTLHYIDPEALPFLPKVLQRLFFDGDIWMARMCDRIVATSEHLRRTLIERGMSEAQAGDHPEWRESRVDRVDQVAASRAGRAGDRARHPVVGIVGGWSVKNQALFPAPRRECSTASPPASWSWGMGRCANRCALFRNSWRWTSTWCSPGFGTMS
jgi:hypothetical protein